jgi:uncharacterized protein (DUF4415 family)
MGGPQGDPEGAGHLQPKVEHMKNEYDFSKGRRNRYASRLKRQVTIRLDDQTIKYFKAISGECGIPYQTLINLYLRDYAATGKRLALNWKSVA